MQIKHCNDIYSDSINICSFYRFLTGTEESFYFEMSFFQHELNQDGQHGLTLWFPNSALVSDHYLKVNVNNPFFQVRFPDFISSPVFLQFKDLNWTGETRRATRRQIRTQTDWWWWTEMKTDEDQHERGDGRGNDKHDEDQGKKLKPKNPQVWSHQDIRHESPSAF